MRNNKEKRKFIIKNVLFLKKPIAFYQEFLYNSVVSGDLWWKVVIFHSFHGVFHNRKQSFRKGWSCKKACLGRFCRRVRIMFLGQYAHTVDAKGRIFVPAKYREALGDTFVITRSTAKCLTVYPMSEWEKFTAKIEELPQAQAAKIRRFLFGNASDVTVDAQGRVGIAQNLREYAGIEKNAVVLGLGSYLEIWAEDAWKAESESESAEEIQDLMIALGC